MQRFVGLPTVLTFLCGFEKKYDGNYEKKISDLSRFGLSRTVAFSIYFCFIFFFMDELHLALILFVIYLGILCMFLLLNW